MRSRLSLLAAAVAAALPLVTSMTAPESGAALPATGGPIQFVDSYGYLWDFGIVNSTAEGVWLRGTVTLNSTDVRTATGLVLTGGHVSFSGDAGVSGVPFNYNTRFEGMAGSGLWINVISTSTGGTVMIEHVTDTQFRPIPFVSATGQPRPGIAN